MNNDIGGLIGFVYHPDSDVQAYIKNCYSNVQIISNNAVTTSGSYRVSGLIGRIYGSYVNIEKCYSHTNNSLIRCDQYTGTNDCTVGGLIGSLHCQRYLEFNNLYTLGSIEAHGNSIQLGGLIGNLYFPGTLRHDQKYCYSSTKLYGTAKTNGYIGGYIGYDDSSYRILNNYFNKDSANYKFVGRSTKSFSSEILYMNYRTQQMRTKATFVDWDFDEIWDIREGVTFPFFRNMPQAWLPTYDTICYDTICYGENFINSQISLVNVTNDTTVRKVIPKLSTTGDSVIYYVVNVRRPVESFATINICDSQLPYYYAERDTTFGVGTANNSVFAFHLPSATGCDSIINLTVTINAPNQAISHTLESCQSVTWNNVSYTDSGIFTQDYGCDSTVTFILTISNPQQINYTIDGCGSLTWNNQTYTESGTYTQEFGCDSIVVVNITITLVQEITHFLEECQQVTWNGETYTQSGVYELDYGCDSIVVLNVTINRLREISHLVSACGSAVWNDETYTTSGTYRQYFGCDSIVVVNVIINRTHQTITHNLYACNSVTWNNETYTESGNYEQDFGCDSIVNLNITVLHSDDRSYEFTTCGSFEWNNTTYTESGTYVQEFACDSVVTLNLTINPSYDIRYIDTIQPGETYNNYGFNISSYLTQTPGETDYLAEMQTVAGCDSIITLTLVVRGTSDISAQEILNSVSVYPNPAYDYVEVEVGDEMSVEQVSIFDARGALVLQKEQARRLDVSALPKANYVISITTNKGIVNRKLIIGE